jgi:3-hydroxybutyryl-CoA dehydrogenase
MNRICVFGESPLVEEYASLFLNKGYSIQVRLNAGHASTVTLPKGARKTVRAVKAVDAAIELTNTDSALKRENLIELDRTLPPTIPILTSALTVSLAEQGEWVRHPERLVGVAALPSLLEGSLVELCSVEATSEKADAAAADLFRGVGKETALVADGVGMVLPRMLCMIVNEAYFAMQEGVAPGRQIDTAMKLGTNYPRGPVEWADRIGLRQVHAVLSALHASFGEDRYRIAPLLQKSMRRAGLK